MTAATIVIVALAACGGADVAATRTTVAQPGDVVERVLLAGALRAISADASVVPATDQSMLAIRWLVADGAVVAAGDRVAELDSAPFVASLDTMRARLAAAETQLRVQRRATEIQLAARRNDVRRAQIERDKAALRASVPRDLQAARAANETQLRLAHAETRLRAAERQLASSSEQAALLDKLRVLDIARTRRAIDNTERAIASLVLRAPRAGVVVVATLPWSDRPLRVGDSVSIGATIATIPDLGKPLEVVAALSDVDDGRVAGRDAGTCTLDAYPTQPIACTVTAVAPIARAQPGRSTLRRSFEVTLALAPIDAAKLRPGMSFEVELRRPPVHGIVVPRGAVVHGADGVRVTLASGESRAVEVAACDAQRCAIARGLADGDVVALAGDRGAS